MAIQPKNTNRILVDRIGEKTAAAGTKIDDELYFEFGYAPAGSNQVVGTTDAHTYSRKTNNVVRDVLLADGSLTTRYGHTGFTSGGDITNYTAALTTTSASAVTIFTYTPTAVGVIQVMMLIDVLTRDQTSEAQSYLNACVSGSCSSGSASAGSVTVNHTVGSALVTITTTASGGNLLVKLQNVNGTTSNTRNSLMRICVIPVSTST